MAQDETLRQKQVRFARLVPRLIDKAFEMGFEVTLGETWRPQVTADYYRSQGRGISNSLHLDKLAIDLNLFKNGQLITDSEGHRPLGEWWEAQGPDHAWGGRFQDGNHYSITYMGRK